jgi:HD-GYP domain-containing protein (c-di-GMP phosphodiesterase class II)
MRNVMANAETINGSLYYLINSDILQNGIMQSFDVFFRTNEDKMVLYCANGETVDEKLRHKIKSNNISNLYINKRDKIHYDLQIEKNLPGILSDPEIETYIKTKIAYESIRNIADILFAAPKAQIIKRYRKSIYSTMDYVFNNNDGLQKLINMTTFDFSTYNHSVNVGIFSIGLTTEIFDTMDDFNLKEMVAGFFLHDIGKCAISEGVLNKKGPLTPTEWKIMKKHPEEGLKILKKNYALSEEAEIIVSQHHERNNGGGYPKGLHGDNIHIFAKICQIADVFDGLTSFRPYRKKYSSFSALTLMKKEMYREFDPEFFAKFVKLFLKQ